MILEQGDIVLGRPDSTLGRAVDFFETLFGDPSEFSHTGVVTRRGEIGNPASEPWVTEAIAHVSVAPLSKNWNRSYAVFRPITLTDEQRSNIALGAEQHQGQSYGWWKLILIAGDAFISRRLKRDTRFFSRLAVWDKHPICSWLVQEEYIKFAKEDFGVPEFTAQPDDIADWCAAHPERFVLICNECG